MVRIPIKETLDTYVIWGMSVSQYAERLYMVYVFLGANRLIRNV